MGFLDDLLTSGQDLLTSTFDPKYGFLGRPVSGALRSGIDFATHNLNRIPEVKTQFDFDSPETKNFLDNILGGNLGQKLIEEPTQQIASEISPANAKIPFGELFKNATLPEVLPGDVGETTYSPIESPEDIDFNYQAHKTTPQDIKDITSTSHQFSGAAESVGDVIKTAPELGLIPNVPMLGATFIPDMAEGFGTHLGEGEYSKAAIDALMLLGIGKHVTGEVSSGVRPSVSSEVKQSEIPVQRFDKVTDQSLNSDLPPLDLGPLKELVNKSDPRLTHVENFVNSIKTRAAEVTNSPLLAEAKVLADPSIETAKFNAETNTIHYNPDFALSDPRQASNVILHEMSHSGSDVTSARQHGMNDIGVLDESPSGGLVGVTRTGGDTVAEVPALDVAHTNASSESRAKYNPKDAEFSNIQDILQHDPEVWKHRDAFEEALGNESRRVSESDKLQSGVTDESLNAPSDKPPKAEDLIKMAQDAARGTEETIDTSSLEKVTETPKAPTSEKVISEPANILRQLLTATKSTKFNKNTLIAELKAKGVEVPEEVSKALPELLQELKARGWVNEKVGGTYSLLIEPPKRVQELNKGAAPKSESTLQKQLQASVDNPKLKTPNLEQSMKEKLTPDEISAIGKLFGGDTSKLQDPELGKRLVAEAKAKATPKAGSEEAKLEADLENESPEVSKEMPVEDITEIEGTKRLLKEQEKERLKTKRTAGEDTKSQIAQTQKLLDAQNKERIAAQKLNDTTKVKELDRQIKETEKLRIAQTREKQASQSEEVKDTTKLAKEEEKLRKAQTKEKFQKKPFTVTLSSGKEITIRGRSLDQVRTRVEARIKESGSSLGITKVTEKLSPLEKELSGGGNNKPPKEPPKFGRESITPEDNFSQAWKKLTPTEKISEVGAIIKAMRSSGDLGHILRQGKLMTVDFLTTGNAKQLVTALKSMKESAFSKAKFEEINSSYTKDPQISKMIDDFGLDLPGIGGHLKEEAFHAGVAEKIPVLGKGLIQPSERLYTSFLNASRVSEAKRMIKIAEDAGFTTDSNPEVYKGLMKAVNIVSSRGDFKRIGPTLNNLSNLMWAPRLKLSRMQLLQHALGGGEMHPLARAELRKSLGRTAAINMSMLGLAALAGANVETDPRNSDWGKIKVGETRIDPWFGLQPIVRSALLMYYGERISPTTGQKHKVSPPEIVGQQVVSGLAPGPSLAYEEITGKNTGGFPINRGERAILGISPLVAEDIYDAFRQYGLIGAIGVAPLSTIGEGVNTFTPKTNQTSIKKKKKEYGF